MIKVTFTLDPPSVDYLDRVSQRLGVTKSHFVREAIKVYGEQMSRLSAEERARMLRAFDDLTAEIPQRPRSDVERELEHLRRGRSAPRPGARA